MSETETGLPTKTPPSKAYSLITKFLVTGLVVYFVIMPTVIWMIDSTRTRKTVEVLEDITVFDAVFIKAVEMIMGVLFFALGSSVGSYLNVLVYRMPMGLSVLFKPSFCPKCGTKIQSKDNIPVLGWLWLKGACRNCQLPISMRYPVVELITGLIFMILYFVELLSGGANLPNRIEYTYKGVVWILLYPKWDLISLYAIHSLMFSTLLTWSIIQKDKQKIPVYSLITAGIMFSFPQIIWPEVSLMKLNLTSGYLNMMSIDHESALIAVISGVFAGMSLFGICNLITLISPNSLSWQMVINRSIFFSLILIGAVLGWKACLIIGLVSVTLMILCQQLFRPGIAESILPFMLITITLLHHLLWKNINLLFPFFSK